MACWTDEHKGNKNIDEYLEESLREKSVMRKRMHCANASDLSQRRTVNILDKCVVESRDSMAWSNQNTTTKWKHKLTKTFTKRTTPCRQIRCWRQLIHRMVNMPMLVINVLSYMNGCPGNFYLEGGMCHVHMFMQIVFLIFDLYSDKIKVSMHATWISSMC